MQSLGMIGFGAIGRSILETWARTPCAGHRLAALLVRPHQTAAAIASLRHWNARETPLVTDDVAAFRAAGCDIVVEAAGQAALRDHAAGLLRAGSDVMIVSTGALADRDFRSSLRNVAEAAGRRILVPSGALAGFDGLASLRRAGLDSVLYRSSKPPSAWKDTAAEDLLDLARVTEPTCFFRGNAAEAALRYPKNANLAATVALAGIGFEDTRVELIADPTREGNAGRVIATSVIGSLDLTVSGASMPGNPKTSALTAMSILAALDARQQVISFV